MTVRIAPSLASAPLDRLGQVISELEKAGADYIHFDVEDGVFTPVMTLGIKIIGDLRSLTTKPFDVHLMTVNPEWLIPILATSGANRIAVHFEACPYPRRTLRKVVELGMIAGIALNPATDLPNLSYLLPYLSYVILLSSEPEEPDCPFITDVMDKLRRGKSQNSLRNLEWVIDGGINEENCEEVLQSGADTLVIGRAVFKDGNIIENMEKLRRITK